MGDRKFDQTVHVTWPRWPPRPDTVKKSSPEPKADDLESWYVASGAPVLPRLFKWWPWINLDLFYVKVKSGPLCFVWEKVKTMDFSETVVVYDVKLTTDDRSDNKFLLTSKLCPLGAVWPLPRSYIHVLNHEKKKMYTIRLQRDLFG